MKGWCQGGRFFREVCKGQKGPEVTEKGAQEVEVAYLLRKALTGFFWGGSRGMRGRCGRVGG